MNNLLPKFWAIIPAAGRGLRMGLPTPKQYLPLGDGRSVLEHSLSAFLAHPQLQRLVIALAKEDSHWQSLPCANDLRIFCVSGGIERADSVLAALSALEGLGTKPMDWVLVHDAARPYLKTSDLNRLLQALKDDPVGGLLAVPVRDTLKQADANRQVSKTLDRNALWHALTPQMFRFAALKQALSAALAAGIAITDEASAMEWAGSKPRLIEGRFDNVKITQAQDLEPSKDTPIMSAASP